MKKKLTKKEKEIIDEILCKFKKAKFLRKETKEAKTYLYFLVPDRSNRVSFITYASDVAINKGFDWDTYTFEAIKTKELEILRGE